MPRSNVVFAQWIVGATHHFVHQRIDGRVRFNHWDSNDYDDRPFILNNGGVKFKLTLFY